MLCACIHVRDVPEMIQIRSVPDELHRKLKVRAAFGMTLSDYLLAEVRQC
jgi:antitoxin FitA